jgi:hypothetical protein
MSTNALMLYFFHSRRNIPLQTQQTETRKIQTQPTKKTQACYLVSCPVLPGDKIHWVKIEPDFFFPLVWPITL